MEVLWTGTAAQGYDANAVLQAGNAKLSAILNPGNWAGGTLSPPIWDSLQQTISYLNLAGYLDDLIGLASINSLKIRKTGATVWTTADLDMGGLASLPVLTSVSGSVASSDQAPLEVM